MIILKIVRNSPQCPLSVVADATLNFGPVVMWSK